MHSWGGMEGGEREGASIVDPVRVRITFMKHVLRKKMKLFAQESSTKLGLLSGHGPAVVQKHAAPGDGSSTGGGGVGISTCAGLCPGATLMPSHGWVKGPE